MPGEEPRIKGRTRRVAVEDWPFVLHDHHPAYITWEQFQRNQLRLIENCTSQHHEHRGAIREGAALLQGLVLCGRCGRRMTIRYMDDGKIPLYECNQLHKNLGEKTCQSLRGDGIDAAVARAFLEAMRPAQLEVSMAAIDQMAQQARRVDRQWELIVERARYEAELARRRFLAIDPENRLVGRTLERDWEAKLAEVERLERESATRPSAVDPPGGPGGAFPDPGVGAGPARGVAGRDDDKCGSQTIARILDQGCLPHAGRDDDRGVDPLADGSLYRLERTTSPALLRCAPDRPRRPCTIACLGGRHRRPPDRRDPRSRGVPLGDGAPVHDEYRKATQIYLIPSRVAVPTGRRRVPRAPRADGRYSAKAAAESLNVNVSTIAAWCQSGILDGIQSGPHGPWWIKLTPEIIARLRKPTRRSWSRRSDS